MTRDDIIRIYSQVSDELCGGTEWCWAGVGEPLQRFANLVAAAERKWQGLTDKEILADEVLRYHFGLHGGAGPVSKKGKAVIEAIEAKLKEKNGY